MTEKNKRHGEPALITRLVVALILSAFSIVAVARVVNDNHLITVVDGEETVTLISSEEDSNELLDMAGVSLKACDAVIANESEYGNMTLEVDRAETVYITADGWTRAVKVLHGTVAQALAKANVTLGEEDYCDWDLRQTVRDRMHITVHRITHEERVVTQILPFETKKVETNKYYIGVEKVTQKGSTGLFEMVFDDTYLDGELVGTEKVSEAVTKAPVAKIISVGTKERPVFKPKVGLTENAKNLMGGIQPTRDGGGSGNVPISAGWRATVNADGTVYDHTGRQVEYQSVISGSATAYYWKNSSGTASGRLAQYGTVAVDPKIIPYGTMLYICSADGSLVYGYAVAGDTGTSMRLGTVLVDLYYDTYQQCCWFGCRKVNVYIIG